MWVEGKESVRNDAWFYLTATNHQRRSCRFQRGIGWSERENPRLSKAGWREAPGRLVKSRSVLIDVREAHLLNHSGAAIHWIPASESKTPKSILMPRTLTVFSTSIHSSNV